jgi:hypothetical protein
MRLETRKENFKVGNARRGNREGRNRGLGLGKIWNLRETRVCEA